MNFADDKSLKKFIMVRIERYSNDKADIWNEFNRLSKNGLFMFDRNYMDYHIDRFTDHSLMFYYKEKLIALLPMSEHGEKLVSHGGLTYGGFITGSNMKQCIMLECFSALIDHAKEKGFKNIIYKCVPHIYHRQPSEEDRFALFFNGALLKSVDVSTCVNLSDPLKMSKLRKRQISRAKRESIIVREQWGADEFEKFIDLENSVLLKRYGVRAAHKGSELKLLHDRFPENIHLFTASKAESMTAGIVLYEYGQVIHTQYMASNDEARKSGALDLAISYVMEKYGKNKKWLDFGISTEHGRIYLNEGLCSQKEGFGGRTVVYETWELRL